jgi:hypothetical protein
MMKNNKERTNYLDSLVFEKTGCGFSQKEMQVIERLRATILERLIEALEVKK